MIYTVASVAVLGGVITPCYNVSLRLLYVIASVAATAVVNLIRIVGVAAHHCRYYTLLVLLAWLQPLRLLMLFLGRSPSPLLCMIAVTAVIAIIAISVVYW